MPTRREGVSDESFRTAADGVVVHNIALGIDATDTDTWVGAAEVDTGKCRGAFTVDDTLWPAGRGSSVVAGEAGAHWPPLLLSTVGVGSTGRGLARVRGLRIDDHVRYERALGEGVSGVAGVAGTDGIVVRDDTLGINSTGAGTRVDTLGVDAGLGARAVVVEETLGPAGLQRVTLVVPDAGADGLARAHSTLCV